MTETEKLLALIRRGVANGDYKSYHRQLEAFVRVNAQIMYYGHAPDQEDD